MSYKLPKKEDQNEFINGGRGSDLYDYDKELNKKFVIRKKQRTHLFDIELLKRLDKYKDATGISISKLLNDLLRDHLEEKGF